MLKIYGAKTYNAVKAVLTAEECGADYQYVEMDFTKGEHKQPGYLKIHPLGKIPAMEHNGNPIFESNNMCRYIANISNKKLYSDDPLKASQIDQMVDLIGYHVGRWISVYFFEEIVKPAFRKEDPDQAALAEAAGFLADQLPYLDSVLGKNEFLCGDDISIADCIASAMIMANEYTSFSINDYPNITRWYNQIKGRPSYAAAMKHFPGGYSFN
jgi:glutathione S-transferase